MTTPVSTEQADTGRLKADQLKRTVALRRFNRLYIYTPIVIVGLICIILLGLLIWALFSPATDGVPAFASGMADIIIILGTLPLMLFGILGPAGLGALIVLYWQRRRQDPPPGPSRLQSLFWRLQNLSDTAQIRVKEVSPRVVQPVIKSHAYMAYISTLGKQLRKMIDRS